MKTIIKTYKIRSKHKFFLEVFKTTLLLIGIIFFNIEFVNGQTCHNKFSDFTSVDASDITNSTRPETLILPPTHTFQKIIQNGETFTVGGEEMDFNNDFAGYLPKEGLSTNGYLFINNATSQGTGGGVAILDIEYGEQEESNKKTWKITKSENIDLMSIGGTKKNASGAITPWGTVISSEEHTGTETFNEYYRNGWQVEIDPKTNPITIKKQYEMGRFAHENAAIHPNQRTIYQGEEDGYGYIYKFVAHTERDLSSGDLYVYKADGIPTSPKSSGTGKWLKLINKGPGDLNITCISGSKGSNNVKTQATCLGATPFNEIEEVEIGPCGKVFFVAKNEKVVYYFEDNDPLSLNPDQSVVDFEGVYVGSNPTYPMLTESGTIVNIKWSRGLPNVIEFDNEGNLYIGHNGGINEIWMVENGHTEDSPKVKQMAITPNGGTPTGFTFSPDNRFMFLSFKKPLDLSGNTEVQIDAEGNEIIFNEPMTIVIARKEHLGNDPLILGCTDVQASNFDAMATKDDCNCIYACNINPNIFINENAITGEPLESLYASSQSIQTQTTITSNDVDVIIRCSEAVDLYSNHITLNAGFKVEAGACLNAEIKPCLQ